MPRHSDERRDVRIFKIIRDWMLPVAMLTGASGYLLYHIMPEPVHNAGPFLDGLIGVMQPLLIFSMLFLTFCRVEPKELKLHRWHWWLLLIQGGLFVLLGLAAWAVLKTMPEVMHDKVVLLESAMICLICPTATAAAVVTRKLGGDVPGITTYIVLINILTAVLVPLVVPMLHPLSDADFWDSFSKITAKVFPLLITPCLCAWLVRYLMPKVHRKLMKYPDLPFYLWAVALTLAIAVTTRSLVHTTMGIGLILSMSFISLVCCLFQFAMGRYIGGRYKPRASLRGRQPMRQGDVSGEAAISMGKEVRKVTAGQSLGQKNTIFAIWMSCTFMTPETAVVGGLYSIWHNIYNSWQLYRAGKREV